MINKLNIIDEQCYEDKPRAIDSKLEERGQETAGAGADHEQQGVDVASAVAEGER